MPGTAPKHSGVPSCRPRHAFPTANLWVKGSQTREGCAMNSIKLLVLFYREVGMIELAKIAVSPLPGRGLIRARLSKISCRPAVVFQN